MQLNISLAPDILFNIGNWPVSNALLASLVITFLFFIFCVISVRKFGLVPTRIQTTIEAIVEYLQEQLEQAFGSKEKAAKFFPLIMTLLLFILIANQFSVIPLFTQILYGDKYLFRVVTTDLAKPLALALIVLGVAHILAFSVSPLRHIGNFIKIAPLFKVRSFGDFGSWLIDFFLGVLDIIGEFAKVISLSFRLFGNVFAGEVMILIISSLSIFTSYLVPIPFIILSIFSGLVQAFVFTMLSIQFIAGTLSSVQQQDAEELKPV